MIGKMQILKKILKFVGLLAAIGVVGILLLAYFSTREKQTTAEVIEKFVNEDISGSGSYWLEMNNAFGQWEKMILVFGYIDDQVPCNLIQEFAAEDSPDRQFRCVRAD